MYENLERGTFCNSSLNTTPVIQVVVQDFALVKHWLLKKSTCRFQNIKRINEWKIEPSAS